MKDVVLSQTKNCKGERTKTRWNTRFIFCHASLPFSYNSCPVPGAEFFALALVKFHAFVDCPALQFHLPSVPLSPVGE